jgi:FkbM family methyltransferase
VSHSLNSRLYGALVELSFLYSWLVPSARGRWRLVRLLKRLQPVDFCPGQVRRNGVSWFINDLKNDAEAALYYGFPYDPETLAILHESVKRGDHVIDVGANIGLITSVLSHQVGDEGRVFAFEASPIHFQSLERNVALQRLRNCTLYCTALAEREAKYTHFTTHSSGSLVSDFSQFGMECIGRAEVSARPLDSILPKDEWSRISFIKLDVDGNEIGVLRGARQILEASKPLVLVEVSERTQAQAGSTAADLLACLREFGFCFRIAPGRFSPDGKEVLSLGAQSTDVLCVHSTKLDHDVLTP